MRITYLYHDCFLIELEKCCIITDYFSQVTVNPLSLFPRDKPCYVLVSHHHKDHFSRDIYSWARQFPLIRFIISKDVYRASKYLFNPTSSYSGHNRVDRDKINILIPGEIYQDALISVEAFGSTDTGNCYVIESEGKRIYFAGDNNAWTWREESTPAEVKDMLNRYNLILNDISKQFETFDLAFIPLDPRMGKDATEGIELFCERFSVNYLIPMHFELWEDEANKKIFHEVVSHSQFPTTQYLPLIRPLQSVEI